MTAYRQRPTVLRNWRPLAVAALDLRDVWRECGGEFCGPACDDAPACEGIVDCEGCMRHASEETRRLAWGGGGCDGLADALEPVDEEGGRG